MSDTKPYSVKPWPDGEQTEVLGSDGKVVYTTDHESACMVRDIANSAFAQALAAAATGEGERSTRALRHIMDCCDTLSPQEFYNICADGLGIPRPRFNKTGVEPEESCVTLTSKLRASTSAPPEGHVLTPDGAVRKVLGTLRYTKDGAVVQRGDWVFSSGSGYCVTDRYTVPLCVLNDTKDGYRDLNVEECYSDREAARADRDPARSALKHGEGGK